jgi:antitoxin component YwqK of YwqJK toxin-antitoxin module
MTANFLKIVLLTMMFFSCTPDPCGDLYVRKTNPYLDEIKTYLKSGDGKRETDIVYTGRCGVYSEGKLSSIQVYKDGFDHGVWKFYHINGKIETKGKFDLGKRIGKWKYFYDNGSLKRVSFYDNGERTGVWFELNTEGDTLWTEEYSKVKDSIY